ncbi:MAG: N-acyl-D-amino-acid deacylase [Microbacteriaceae bacterium]|jgi:dihydroorotase/N-acyl-D-amino-acid deacylase|nr:N-acyl-D-amino-acid deacylase [Microbacteriaceae bacterium]
MSEVELVVSGGRLVDGTGNPWRYADVAVDRGRIVAVTAPGEAPTAARVVDATGHIVAPGFVDIHSHSDLAVLARPGAEEKLRQGVTTEVVGNCGISVLNSAPESIDDLRSYALPILGFPEVPWDWSDTSSYLDRVEAARPAVNVATLLGLGSVRCAVSGFDSARPTSEQRQRMVALARDALVQGAAGLSSGLVYAPGSYSTPEEIWELAAEAARVGAIYSTHMRDQGDGFLDSVREALEVGNRTGVAVHIAHHKVVGRRNWGLVSESLRLLDEARQAGIDAGSDVYPYLAGSTAMTALLPDWVAAGGHAAMMERLRDPEARSRIKDDWRTGRPNWDNRIGSLGFENISISYVGTPENEDLVGLSLADAAARRGRSDEPADFLLDLLEHDDGKLGNIQFACSEDDLRQVMRHETTCFGSDGLLVGERPHPRLHGTFPWILGEYVRESGVLSLEVAIRKMTSQAARRLSLPGIGLVEPGYRADLTVFDPETVAGPATYDQPTLPPVGIREVIVGGQFAIESGEVTGVRAGTALRRMTANR